MGKEGNIKLRQREQKIYSGRKMKYAEGTTVSAAKTQGEIAQLVERYGATQFSSGWQDDKAAISFAANGRLVRFVIVLPSLDYIRKTMKLPRGMWGRDSIKAETVAKCRDAEVKRLWRCLLLAALPND